MTSAIAMLVAVPISIGIAVFLTELCPMPLRRPIGIAIELLAGVPSIIYGIWGLFFFAPFLQRYVQPELIAAFKHVPVLDNLFAGPPYGIGILTSALILAMMVLPFVTAVCRDVFETVPPVLKEAAYGHGLDDARGRQERRHSLYPRRHHRRRHARPWPRPRRNDGRDIRHRQRAPDFGSILAPGTTISATIANEFTEAVGDIYTSSLIALGLILFFITFIVLALARLMLMRIEKKAGA